MKKYAAWLFSVLLAVCLTAGAEAQASKEAQIERYIGAWIGEDYRMYVRLEDDEIYSRLTQAFGNYVWEFDRCWFDAEEDLSPEKTGEEAVLSDPDEEQPEEIILDVRDEPEAAEPENSEETEDEQEEELSDLRNWLLPMLMNGQAKIERNNGNEN